MIDILQSVQVVCIRCGWQGEAVAAGDSGCPKCSGPTWLQVDYLEAEEVVRPGIKEGDD
jgi:hypothetical protein